MIQFKNINESMPCPVCGYPAKIIQTSPARDWAELHCENCQTYALKADALEDADNLYLFSGYVRHHQPHMMTVHCHDNESVQQITTTPVSQDERMKYLLSFYYQRMSRFGEYIGFDPHPAIAYSKDKDDLRELVQHGVDCGYLLFENEMISVTEAGKDFMDEQVRNSTQAVKPSRPTVFISYNHGSQTIADRVDSQLQPYADVKIDRRCIKPWGSIKSFMNSIRDQDFAVLVISDSYLKSTACLYEVMQMMKEKDWDERVMYVVTADAHGVYDPHEQVNYIGHWEETEQKLRNAIKGHDPAAVSYQAAELKKISLITLHVGEFLIKLADAQNPDVDDAIKKVVERVRGSAHNPPEHTEIIAKDEFEDKITTVPQEDAKKTTAEEDKSEDESAFEFFYGDCPSNVLAGIRQGGRDSRKQRTDAESSEIGYSVDASDEIGYSVDASHEIGYSEDASDEIGYSVDASYEIGYSEPVKPVTED